MAISHNYLEIASALSCLAMTSGVEKNRVDHFLNKKLLTVPSIVAYSYNKANTRLVVKCVRQMVAVVPMMLSRAHIEM